MKITSTVMELLIAVFAAQAMAQGGVAVAAAGAGSSK